jgi:hypothetical protein
MYEILFSPAAERFFTKLKEKPLKKSIQNSFTKIK